MMDLQFANVQTILRLTRGKGGWGHCPCHRDEHPSLEVKRGREPGRTLVTCWAGCKRGDLLAHFRKLGYRLGPMRMAPPKPMKRPIEVATSVAFRVLTRAEQTMYAMISKGGNPSYDEFEAAGVRRKSIAGGLRAMQALGLIGVIRSTRKKGCRRYQRNESWMAHQWRRWEPSGGAMLAAVNRAKAVAIAARKGGEDISIQPAWKTEASKTGLLVPEVAVRGGVFAPVTYERRTLASKDNDRPENSMKGEDKRRAGAGRWRPPCGGIDCGKQGECLHHEWCPAERLGKSNGDGWPSR
jgi:hypothetical protein